ncbi:uncharacterized protein A4U43_C06F15150 [Asparagus officinalis]|uniref:SLC26A/SulP transporter domain-containing protein n=1 Tax=Asparagus officinalis TaxID=4686 RepID=A0A5P1ESL6_ASPOF|nr:uncharacterized protein A4U43_C06F15150 [Asparagus officinalis]
MERRDSNHGDGGDGNNSSNNNEDHREIKVMEVIHKVVLPPPRSTLKKMKIKFKETFFPDDPFRHFKGMPLKTKWVFGFQYLFPIFRWAPAYSFSLFKSDLIAGLTIASLAIPQGISYANLANLPPIIGLYSSFVPPLVYSVLGSSRDLAVGPTSIASLIMGSMLRPLANPNTESHLFLRLALTSTFIAGLFQASLGILRLGFIIDFLSKSTLIGFMAGAAIIVSLQQLKALLGIVHFTKQMGLVQVTSSVFHRTDEWSWQTILMGISFLVFLLSARHVSMKKPKLFWISAGAPLASVIISTLLVYLIKAQKDGISIIGKLERGLNPPSWDKLIFESPYLSTVLRTGIITGIISLTIAGGYNLTTFTTTDESSNSTAFTINIGSYNLMTLIFSRSQDEASYVLKSVCKTGLRLNIRLSLKLAEPA